MGLPVEIVRSTKRRKTVQAVLGDGVIRVHVPARLSQREIDVYVAELVPRLERRFRSDHIDLDARAAVLARRFELPRPRSIVWADQRKRWGSCDTRTGDIRISTRLAEFPPWVLDYVVVHELCHLVYPDHRPAFGQLVDRYPRAERARGYLLAKQDDSDQPNGAGERGGAEPGEGVDGVAEDDLVDDGDPPDDVVDRVDELDLDLDLDLRDESGGGSDRAGPDRGELGGHGLGSDGDEGGLDRDLPRSSDPDPRGSPVTPHQPELW
jgi:hypothetical protein